MLVIMVGSSSRELQHAQYMNGVLMVLTQPKFKDCFFIMLNGFLRFFLVEMSRPFSFMWDTFENELPLYNPHVTVQGARLL
jgi:hypothetical protein